MYILSINMWFQKLMKQFFFGIDSVVYNFISIIYDLLISISRTSILSQADIIDMGERIYNLLTIFMIFKVTLSLITYVVNPDDFSDKSKGISKLVMNIIISLGLLILTPYIFSMAYRLQTIILEDNTMAALIFTEKVDSDVNESINTAGDEMAFLTMSAFLTPNLSITALHNCVDLTIKGSNGTVKFNEACSGVAPENYSVDVDKANTMASLTKENSNFSATTLQNYVAGVENQNLGLMFRQDLVIATDNDNEFFIMEYKYIFSTIVGVIIVLLLLSFCMDIGLRSIKLSFLQLIAPIPILSYVDPKSGKDGMFKKWYQLCFKTYLSLFIRLLALYFAIYIIGRLDSMVDIVDGTYQSHLLVKIFILIGALMFAKQLPKILEGLGIKLDGDGKFTLNPFKKFENEALGGKQIIGFGKKLGKKTLGAGKGFATGAFVGGLGMASGAGFGRGISGAFGGMMDGIRGKKFGEIRKAQIAKNSQMRQARLDGSTFFGRMGARVAGTTGLMSASESLAREKNVIETDNRTFDDRIKSIEDNIAPTKTKISERKRFTEAVGSMESRAKSEIENGNSWVGQEYFARKKNASYMSDNIGKTVTRTLTQRDEDFAVYSAKKAQKDMENAQKRIREAKTVEEYNSAIADLEKAENTYERETALSYEIHEKLESGDIHEEIVVSADDAARAEAMASSWLTDEGMKAYMTDATSGTIDDATFRNTRATAEKAGKTIGVTLATDGADIHSEYGRRKGEIGELEREIYDQEQEIEDIKLEKAKLGDELRDIERRERKIKADESVFK